MTDYCNTCHRDITGGADCECTGIEPSEYGDRPVKVDPNRGHPSATLMVGALGMLVALIIGELLR